ncbi:TPA: hypothetical protein ACH3X2_003106 [Trebouxia sp. C0005]|nr:MAG: serine threonine- kinase SAPK3-like [Trebouxia sp. A1-2]
MGNVCGCASPQTKPAQQQQERQYTTPVGQSLQGKDVQNQSKKIGLAGTHQAVKLLGRGAAADIWLFRDLKHGNQVAVKLFERPLPQAAVQAVLREIKIQTEIGEGHANLVNVYQLILTPTHLALCMEWASGGSLTSYVADKWQSADPSGLVMAEDEARYFFKQFISAISYCHQHHIAHRDMKLDNTLFDGQKPPFIKICDFGFARAWQDPALYRMSSRVGTPEYMSPELLHNGQDGTDQAYDPRSTDVWAAGVMLVVALCGAFPFDHTQHQHRSMEEAELDLWMQEVNQQWFQSEFIKANVNKLSSECRSLLDRIFVADVKQRITVEGIMQHPWYLHPLPSHYQSQLQHLDQVQAQKDAHIQSRRIDPTLVEKRNQAIAAMVQEATQASAHGGHHQKGQLRPLHLMDFKDENLQEIDLTEAAVLAAEGSQHFQAGLATLGGSGSGAQN